MKWILLIAFLCGQTTQCPSESPFDGTGIWIGFEDEFDCRMVQARSVDHLKTENPGAIEAGTILVECLPFRIPDEPVEETQE